MRVVELACLLFSDLFIFLTTLFGFLYEFFSFPAPYYMLTVFLSAVSFSVCMCLCLQLVHSISAPHFHIQFSSVAQSCPTLCDPMNLSLFCGLASSNIQVRSITRAKNVISLVSPPSRTFQLLLRGNTAELVTLLGVTKHLTLLENRSLVL